MPGPEIDEAPSVRWLRAAFLISLAIALLGSLGFLHPAFQDLPYSWF